MPRQLSTQDRVVLLMSLVPYLIEQGSSPVPEIARTFGVDERVIRKLVRFLGTAGVPGETLTYQHEDLFDIDWEVLEQDDLVRLVRVVAIDETPRFSSLETSAMIAGLHALTPMLPAETQRVAEAAARKLAEVRPVDAAANAVSVTPEGKDATLSAITAALRTAQQISFQYRDANGASTDRIVDPWQLTQAGGAWYVWGFCHDRGEARTFLVDRMREVETRPGQTIAGRPNHRSNNMIELSGEEIMVRVRVKASALHRLTGFAPRVMREMQDGWVQAEVDLLHPAVAVSLVQAAPGDIEVESPGSARNAVFEWARRALSQYEL